MCVCMCAPTSPGVVVVGHSVCGLDGGNAGLQGEQLAAQVWHAVGVAQVRGQRSARHCAKVSVHGPHSLVVDWYDWGVGEKVGAAATAGRGIGCLNAGRLVAVVLQGATDSETSTRLLNNHFHCWKSNCCCCQTVSYIPLP